MKYRVHQQRVGEWEMKKILVYTSWYYNICSTKSPTIASKNNLRSINSFLTQSKEKVSVCFGLHNIVQCSRYCVNLLQAAKAAGTELSRLLKFYIRIMNFSPFSFLVMMKCWVMNHWLLLLPLSLHMLLALLSWCCDMKHKGWLLFSH